MVIIMVKKATLLLAIDRIDFVDIDGRETWALNRSVHRFRESRVVALDMSRACDHICASKLVAFGEVIS